MSNRMLRLKSNYTKRKEMLIFIEWVKKKVNNVLNGHLEEYKSLYTETYVECSHSAKYHFDFVSKDAIPLSEAVIHVMKESIKQSVEEWVQTSVLPINDHCCLSLYVRKFEELKRGVSLLRDGCYMDMSRPTNELIDYWRQIWGQNLLEELGDKVSKAVLNSVQRQRNGEHVVFLKETIDSYIEMGSIEWHQMSVKRVNVFIEGLGRKFSQLTVDYYMNLRKKLIAELQPMDYIREFSDHLKRESDRFETTEQISDFKRQLMASIERILIIEIFGEYTQVFANGLVNVNIDFLHLIYKMVQKLEQQINELVEIYNRYLTESFMKVHESKTPVIEILIQFYEKQMNFMHKSFDSNPAFINTLNKVFGQVFEHISDSKQSHDFMAQNLAQYFDHILKSKGSDENKRQIITVLIHLSSFTLKEAFQRFYFQYLAERLMGRNFYFYHFNDAEKFAFTQISSKYGFGFAKKMSTLIQELENSRELSNEFRNSPLNRSETKLQIDVLSQFNGQDLHKDSLHLIPHHSIIELENSFRQFYRQKHKSKELTFIYIYSKAEIDTNFWDKKYRITASALQTFVLLQFNDNKRHSIKSLKSSLCENERNQSISDEQTLVEVLKTLLRAKLLVSNDWDEKQQTFNSNDSTILELNERFERRKTSFSIDIPLEGEVKAQRNTNINRITNERKKNIEAAIARVMKVEKKLKFSVLTEVLKAENITSDISAVEKAVEFLIERLLLERKGDELIYLV